MELSSVEWESDDDVPLTQLATRITTTVAGTPASDPEASIATPCYSNERWQVTGEQEHLVGEKWIERAHAFRKRAHQIYDVEKTRLMTGLGGRVTKAQCTNLASFTLSFSKGTRCRGVCDYAHKTIRISARLVDGGLSPDQVAQVFRHELSHAANPGQKHNCVWSAFNISIGGDGKRCCSSKEASSIIGHKVEIYCPSGDAVTANTGHFFAKRQIAPARKWLANKICRQCNSKGIISHLRYRFV